MLLEKQSAHREPAKFMGLHGSGMHIWESLSMSNAISGAQLLKV